MTPSPPLPVRQRSPAPDGDDYATLPAIGYHADLGAILITALRYSPPTLSCLWRWVATFDGTQCVASAL